MIFDKKNLTDTNPLILKLLIESTKAIITYQTMSIQHHSHNHSKAR